MNELLIGIEAARWFDPHKPCESMKYVSERGIEALDLSFSYVFSPDGYKEGKKYDLPYLPDEDFIKSFSEMKAASEKYGVKIAQAHAPYPTYFEDDPVLTELGIMTVEKLIGACAYLGCDQLIVHPHEDPWHPHQNYKWNIINIEMFSRFIPAAKKYGVKICLENLLCVENDEIIGGICSSVEETCYLIDSLNEIAGADVFGFCFDVGHLNASGLDVYSFIKGVGSRISALHLHDNDGRSDAHLFPYTQIRDQWGLQAGVNWEDVIKGLREINYRGCLSFETFRAFYHFPREVWDEAIALNLAIGKYFRKRILE